MTSKTGNGNGNGRSRFPPGMTNKEAKARSRFPAGMTNKNAKGPAAELDLLYLLSFKDSRLSTTTMPFIFSTQVADNRGENNYFVIAAP
jgi:hypothetical protein